MFQSPHIVYEQRLKTDDEENKKTHFYFSSVNLVRVKCR